MNLSTKWRIWLRCLWILRSGATVDIRAIVCCQRRVRGEACSNSARLSVAFARPEAERAVAHILKTATV